MFSYFNFPDTEKADSLTAHKHVQSEMEVLEMTLSTQNELKSLVLKLNLVFHYLLTLVKVEDDSYYIPPPNHEQLLEQVIFFKDVKSLEVATFMFIISKSGTN